MLGQAAINAYMNINVRVLSAAAQTQIKALQAQVAMLQKQLVAGGAAATGPKSIGGPASLMALRNYGSKLQWTGRQIRYNFTLPILLAGAAATKFAFDNEKAFTRVKKLYGDDADALKYMKKNQDAWGKRVTASGAVTRVFKRELESLEKVFGALSSRYGENQKEIIETAGAWAAAGSSGVALAKSTELSIKASILGDMELEKATESLIAIQSQYSLSTEGLTTTLNELNAVENQTGIGMEGLIKGFSRAAGSAREYGIDVRHLAAMLAALVPATGTATTAGNALKTIMSRILSPTKEAAAVMAEFGVVTSDATWQSSNGMERLQIIAAKMDNDLKKTGKGTKDLADDMFQLSDSQRAVVATTLGSRYQVNRFLVLMRELSSEEGYFQKALNATQNDIKVTAQATKELNTVLESSPKRLEILGNTIKNTMATAIAPLIPYMIYLAMKVSDLMKAFGNLSPGMQKFILLAAGAMASIGIFVPLLGSLVTLVTLLIAPVAIVANAFFAMGRATAAAAAVTKAAAVSFFASSKIIALARNIAVGAWVSGMAAMKALAITGWAAISATNIAGWAATNLGTVLGWVVGLGLEAAGWAKKQGLVIAAWAKYNAINIAGWTADLAIARAAQAKSLATITAGWLATQALNAIAWVKYNAVTLGGWTVNIAAARVANSTKLLIEKTSAAARLVVLIAAWGAISAINSAGWIKQNFITAAGSAKNLAYWGSAWLAINAITIAGWVKQTLINAAGWIKNQSVHSAAWVLVQAITAAGWIKTHVINILGWIAYNAATFAGWAASHAITFAGWIKTRAISAAGWVAYNSSIAAAWVVKNGIHAAGWALTAGIHAAGWIAVNILSGKGLLTLLRTVGTGMAAVAAAMSWPVTLAIAAVVLAFLLFRNKAQQIWNNIVSYFSDSNSAMVKTVISGWNLLPQGVANALTAVVRIVSNAAKQIYEWFSYINPFARHSPSLVENVTNGMGVVSRQFGKASSAISGHVRGAYRDIKSFGKAIRGLLKGAATFEHAQERSKIKKFAPGALKEFDKLSKRLRILGRGLDRLKSKMSSQQAVVDKWTDALDRANKKLSKQEKVLERLQKRQQRWQEDLSAAQDSLNYFASAPIEGMGAMGDAIFENEMAQKSLRYEMMKLEDVVGTLDEIKSKIEAVNGAQELLSGQKAGLRSGGAGSEILSQYDDQISALEKTKNQQNEAADALQNMSEKISDLQRKGEMLDLEESLKFDPLTRQIDKLANAMEELPFDVIIAGVTKAAADIEIYEKKLRQATRAVEKQGKVVDRLTDARDRMQDSLNLESEKLEEIRSKYELVAEAIGSVEQAMSQASQAAGSMADKIAKAKEAKAKAKAAKKAKIPKKEILSPAVQNFRDAAGGNFAKVSGNGIPFRTDWSSQEDGLNDMFQDLTELQAKQFAKFNPFDPIIKKWEQFKGWWGGAWGRLVDSTKDMFSEIFSGVGGGDVDGKLDKIKEKFRAFTDEIRIVWEKTKEFFTSVGKAFKAFWRLIEPILTEIKETVQEALGKAWEKIGPEVEAIFKELGPLFTNFLAAVKPVLAVLGLQFAILSSVILNVFNRIIKPAIEMFGSVIANVFQVVRGILQVFSGFFMLFTGDFKGAFEKMGSGILNIFSGIFGTIGALFKGAFKMLLGLVMGVVEGIFGFFKWLWNELVGNSIVPDIIDGVWFWFEKLGALGKWVWDKVLKPVFDFFVDAFRLVIGAVKLWFQGIKLAWSVLATLGTWFWENVLKPVGEVFVWLWDKVVKPNLEFWWDAIKLAWGALAKLGTWFWDNVLKPVYDKVKEVWDKYIQPALAFWWEGMKIEWKALKAAATWFWDNVLKPVYDKVKEVWDKYVKPALDLWWSGIKTAWDKLKGLAGWVWDNVLKPVFNQYEKLWDKVKPALNLWWSGIKKEWDILKGLAGWVWTYVLRPVFNQYEKLWDKVKPALNLWWSGIKKEWDILKGLADWVWDNVLKPVFNQYEKVWDKYVKPELELWWSRIKTAWNKLKDLGGWIKDIVMDPVFNAFKNGWERIKEWLVDSKDMLASPAKAIVSTVVKAVNLLIMGLNAIPKSLPGFNWSIKPIQLASGGKIPDHLMAEGGKIPGRRANAGFKTTGARAIVGEGKANYPEFVIPTDPTYRNRAKGLLDIAASKIGHNTLASSNLKNVSGNGAIPQFGIGGWLGDKYEDAKGLAKDISNIPRKIFSKTMDPLLNAGAATVNKVKWEPVKPPPLSMIKEMKEWVKGSEQALGKSIDKYTVPTGGNVSLDPVANGNGTSSWKGGTFTNQFISAMQKAEQLAGSSMSVMQGGFRPTTSYSGTSHQADAVDIRPNNALIGAMRRVGIAAGDRTGLGSWAPHTHAVPGPGAGRAGGSAIWQFQDYMARGGMNQSYSSPWGLEEGGIVSRTQGGVKALLGEGRNDEAVVPLPRNWKSAGSGPFGESSGGDEINFYGDLSFPNITNPDDAHDFIENLKALAKD